MFICIIAKIQPLSIPKNTVKIIYSVSQSFTAKEKEKWNYGIFIMKTKKNRPHDEAQRLEYEAG